LIGVEVGDGWFVRLTRFAREDRLQIAGDCTSGLLYTPSMLCDNWSGEPARRLIDRNNPRPPEVIQWLQRKPQYLP